jgi:hypothetical protein
MAGEMLSGYWVVLRPREHIPLVWTVMDSIFGDCILQVLQHVFGVL